MGKYSKEKNYDKERAMNAQRKDFECPCCGKNIPLSEAKLEKFELYREYTFFPKPGYLVHYGGYRICKTCLRKRNFLEDLPFKIIKYGFIIALIATLVALIIDYKEYGLMTYGFWSILLCSTFGAVLVILPFVIVYTIFYKYTKSFDFDRNLKKNAVDWFPQFEKEK